VPRGPRNHERTHEGAMTSPAPARAARRCATCARIRPYQADDRFCYVCGSDALDAACECGREYDYALGEAGELHCPRCGKALAGRVEGFEA
jgi:hypothetical protein